MQRKLSEIAEIPKILSSTLATVTQTFDKLTTNMPPSATTCRQHFVPGVGNEYCHHLYVNEQKRKLSYDEDVYDYELSDDNDADDGDGENENGNVHKGENDEMPSDEQFDAKIAYLQLKRYAARQRKSKEVTPESDYASENNYPQSDAEKETDEEENGDDDDDDDNISDIYEQFNLSVQKTPLGHATKDESDVEEEDDDDFLTTTFTWNLRNKPKLLLNGKDNDNDLNLHKLDDEDNCVEQQKSVFNENDEQMMPVKEESPEKQHKVSIFTT